MAALLRKYEHPGERFNAEARREKRIQRKGAKNAKKRKD
jgi:hypothetical protein